MRSNVLARCRCWWNGTRTFRHCRCCWTKSIARASLKLSPGVWLLDSAFPVVSLIHAHGLPAEDRKLALSHAAALLARGTAEKALVWREGFKLRLRHLRAAEHALLLALQAGHTLEVALTQAGHAEDQNSDIAFDFADCLAPRRYADY